MKKINLITITILSTLLFIGACSQKIPMRSWTPPDTTNILPKVKHIVVVNQDKGDPLSDMFADSLREKLSLLPFVTIAPSPSLERLANQLKDYHLNPQIPQKEKVAYLSYVIKENLDLKRQQERRQVTLVSCNYLREKEPCYKTGRVELKSGIQNIRYKQQIHFRLKDAKGKEIIPQQVIVRTYNKKMKLVPGQLLLRKKVSDLIAEEFTKRVLPYRKYIDVDLPTGDSIAVKMIEKGAYNLALKHLEKRIKAGNKTEANIYLQGFVFEILGNLTGALELYHQASLLDKTNQTIREAIQRVETITAIKRNSK